MYVLARFLPLHDFSMESSIQHALGFSFRRFLCQGNHWWCYVLFDFSHVPNPRYPLVEESAEKKNAMCDVQDMHIELCGLNDCME